MTVGWQLYSCGCRIVARNQACFTCWVNVVYDVTWIQTPGALLLVKWGLISSNPLDSCVYQVFWIVVQNSTREKRKYHLTPTLYAPKCTLMQPHHRQNCWSFLYRYNIISLNRNKINSVPFEVLLCIIMYCRKAYWVRLHIFPFFVWLEITLISQIMFTLLNDSCWHGPLV